MASVESTLVCSDDKDENDGQYITNDGRMKVNTGIRHTHPSAALHSERATRPPHPTLSVPRGLRLKFSG